MSPEQAGVRGPGTGSPEPDAAVPAETDAPQPVTETPAPQPGAPQHHDDPVAEVAPAERWRPTPLLVIVSVVALLGIFGTAFYFSKYHRLSNREHTQTVVTRASADFLIAFTNFNANTVDADFRKIQSLATGDFADQAAQEFSSQTSAALAAVQATARGQIKSLYVESIDGNTATTFADVDQTIANLKFAHPEQDELRIALTLTHTSKGWLVSEVTVLQAPSTPAPSATSPSTSTPPASTPPTTAAG